MYLDVNKFGKISVIAMIVMTFISDFLSSMMGFPESIRYVIYVLSYIITLCVVLSIVTYEAKGKIILHLPKWLIPIIIFQGYIVFTAFLHRDIYSAEYFFRQYMVGYSAFAGTILFLDADVIRKNIYKFLFALLVLHMLLSVVEYFKMHEADSVGGLFGTYFGYSNTCLHAYLLLCTIVFVSGYLTKKIKSGIFFAVILMAMLTAAVAELKIYYFELVLVFLVYMLLSKQFFKSLVLAILLGVILVLGYMVFLKIYPGFTNFFSKEGVQEYLDSGYAGKTFNVTRTNGYSFIYENMFFRSKLMCLFGHGFTSDEANMVTEYNVHYFTYSKLFYYGGIIGSLMYYMLPIHAFIKLMKRKMEDTVLISALTGAAIIIFSRYSSECSNAVGGVMYYTLLALGYSNKKK